MKRSVMIQMGKIGPFFLCLLGFKKNLRTSTTANQQKQHIEKKNKKKNYELVHFWNYELNFELVHAESELSLHWDMHHKKNCWKWSRGLLKYIQWRHTAQVINM